MTESLSTVRMKSLPLPANIEVLSPLLEMVSLPSRAVIKVFPRLLVIASSPSEPVIAIGTFRISELPSTCMTFIWVIWPTFFSVTSFSPIVKNTFVPSERALLRLPDKICNVLELLKP